MTKKEKRIKTLREKLSFYEGKLYKHMTDDEQEATESVFSRINRQEVIMLNVTIDDLQEELDQLES